MAISGNSKSIAKARDPLPWLVVLLAVTVIGIIIVSWMFIESLQDNSEQLRKYKIKPEQTMTVRKAEMEFFGAEIDRDSDRLQAHPSGQRMSIDADELMSHGRFHEARALYEKALTGYAQDVKGRKWNSVERESVSYMYSCMAYCSFRLGDLKPSLQQVNSSLALDPARQESYRWRAYLYEKLGKRDLARADMERAAQLGEGINSYEVRADLLRQH